MVMMIGFIFLLRRISVFSNDKKVDPVGVEGRATVGDRIPSNTDSEESNHDQFDDNVCTYIANQ